MALPTPTTYAARKQLLLHQIPACVEWQRSEIAFDCAGADSCLASSTSGGETHSSASSSVFGITAMPQLAPVGLPAGLQAHVDALAVGGKAMGSFDRHRKHAVRLFMRNGTGSMACEQPVGRQVGDADAGAVAVALRRQVEHADARDLRRRGLRRPSISSRPTTLGSMPAPE